VLDAPRGLEATIFEVHGEELVMFSFPKPPFIAPAQLTPAESDVVQLILSDLSNAQIAARRGTALRTVANQVAQIFTKLGVSSRSELVTLLTNSGRAPKAKRR
jgi:DNA-binding CsgD family transcriptional regulator